MRWLLPSWNNCSVIVYHLWRLEFSHIKKYRIPSNKLSHHCVNSRKQKGQNRGGGDVEIDVLWYYRRLVWNYKYWSRKPTSKTRKSFWDLRTCRVVCPLYIFMCSARTPPLFLSLSVALLWFLCCWEAELPPLLFLVWVDCWFAIVLGLLCLEPESESCGAGLGSWPM